MCAQCVLEVMVPTSCYVAEPSKVMQILSKEVTDSDHVRMTIHQHNLHGEMHTTIETLFSFKSLCRLRIFRQQFQSRANNWKLLVGWERGRGCGTQ